MTQPTKDTPFFTVQLFGYDWDDDKTAELLTRDREDGTAGLDLLGYTIFTTFEEISEAMTVADWLWDAFWESKDDNYRDSNALPSWQYVVAVFRGQDEAGKNPVYTRGYHRSLYASWNDTTT